MPIGEYSLGCRQFDNMEGGDNRMYNSELLRDFINESGYKGKFIAEKCGLTYAGFYKKLTGQNEFTASEIAELKTILDLKPDDVMQIFFT